jgi:hypothetical protein
LLAAWIKSPLASRKTVLPYGAVTAFLLDDANEGVTHTADSAGPFKLTVLKP